jgi:hypothetical protein
MVDPSPPVIPLCDDGLFGWEELVGDAAPGDPLDVAAADLGLITVK